MDSGRPSHLVVGHLNKAHGTRGELFLWPLTVDPDGAFAAGTELHLADEAGEAPDVSFAPVRVQGARPFKRGFLIKLEGVDSRDQAEWLAGRYLVRPLAEVRPLEEGEVFYHDLLGMSVEAADGVPVGEIVEVYELRPVHMLEVARESGTVLIPFARDMVRQLDREAKRLVMELPEGLLDL
jgi:16S rRNA processing protein RimM